MHSYHRAIHKPAIHVHAYLFLEIGDLGAGLGEGLSETLVLRRDLRHQLLLPLLFLLHVLNLLLQAVDQLQVVQRDVVVVVLDVCV